MHAVGRIFDSLEHLVEGPRGRRVTAALLVVAFVAAIVIIEVNRLGWLPPSLGERLPTVHLAAISFAFNVLLVAEVIGLIFALANSVSRALGKQIEILSLILVRDVFKEFAHFSEPIQWSQVEPVLADIIAATLSALAIFVVIGFYYRIQRHRPITSDQSEQASFILAKKAISLFLLGALVFIMVNSLWFTVIVGRDTPFFETFYTLLIFTDVLIVFISLRYSDSYHVSFRNSGFAVATALVRLALIAPIIIGSIMGVGVALFALGLSAAYNRFTPEMVRTKEKLAEVEDKGVTSSLTGPG